MPQTSTSAGPRILIPADFNAVTVTAPPRVTVDTLAYIQAAANKIGLPQMRGHRILYGSQVEECDSAAVAAVMTIMRGAQAKGHEFAICDPAPIVRRYLEIYGASTYLKGRILYADAQGFYQSTMIPFIPPYVPAPQGRWDIYRGGKVQSMVLTADKVVDIAPVDLNNYAIPTVREVVHSAGKTRRLARVVKTHEALMLVRRFDFSADEAMAKLDTLMKLHDWYKAKGFDFKDIDIWQSDDKPGQITHVIEFRDKAHYDQFQTLLKVDASWKPLLEKLGEGKVEFHKVF